MGTWTQADIDQLKAAIASGILTVRYDGPPARTITYQSTADMIRALALMQTEVGRQTGQTTTMRLAGTSKGFWRRRC